MNKKIRLWQFVGFTTTGLLGSLLHFLYSWTGNSFAALIASVNESTWEHMKLLFFPMFLFALTEGVAFGKEIERFWCVKARGTLLALLLVPVLFYTFGGAFGPPPAWLNVLFFFLSAGVGYLYETKKFTGKNVCCRFPRFHFWLLCFIAVLFWIFTFFPPRIPLFSDPLTGTYGI